MLIVLLTLRIATLLLFVLVVPLLIIFTHLGARYPGAGGVAGFVRAAFGPYGGAAVDVLALGTFSLGIPAIALVGGNYVALVLGAGPVVAFGAASGLLLLAGLVNWAGAKLSGRVQNVLSGSLVLLLVAAAVTAYIRVLGGTFGLAQDFRGPMAKPHRMATMTVACLLGIVEFYFFDETGFDPAGTSHLVILKIAAAIIALGSVLTCGTRIHAIAAQLRAR